MKDQNTPTNTLKEILYNYLGQFKNDGYLSQGNTDTTTNAIESLISEAVNKAEKKAWQNGWDSCQQIQIPIITSAVEIKSAQAVNKASVRIKLPHIQEFYDWCTEEDIDEEVMYKVAGWLGGEIYIQDAFIEDRIKALSGDNSEDK